MEVGCLLSQYTKTRPGDWFSRAARISEHQDIVVYRKKKRTLSTKN
jgi:hypothetical protein